MKPRQVTSLTLEDMHILLQVAWRAAPHHDGKLSLYLRVVVPADRRDAELMLGLTDLRSDGLHADVRHCQVWWGQDGYSMGTRYSDWTSDRWSDGSKIT